MHQQQQPIPLSIIRNLKCRHCGRFVTCGPVHVVPADGSMLCGRCRTFAKPQYRNVAYEALASIFYYPCCHWSAHCSQRLGWNGSLEHEPHCVYQSACTLFWRKPRVVLCTADRKLPECENINLSHITEEQVIDQLKCIYCENYLSCDPVYIGADGKNVCHRCTTSNGVPSPQGGTAAAAPLVRNLSYEKLASIIIFPCIYRFRGCTIRLRYGRELWQHETDCSYGQVYNKKKTTRNGNVVTKKLSTTKERGVIETHSGHIYGTITPNSALFSPPKPNKVDSGSGLTQELVSVIIRKKQQQNNSNSGGGDDSQSMESVERTTDDSNSNSASRRNTKDSRSDDLQSSIGNNDDDDFDGSVFKDEPLTPTGYIPKHGYFPDNIPRPSFRLSVSDNNNYYPNNPNRLLSSSNNNNYNNYLNNNYLISSNNNIKYTPSFNYYPNNDNPDYNNDPRIVKRSESLRVGSKEIINELKARHSRQQQQQLNQNSIIIPESNNNLMVSSSSSAWQRNNMDNNNPYMQCNSLQDIVQVHDKVLFN